MSAIWMVGAGDLRRRWRAVVVVMLLVGVVGAIAFATVAGARRTGSALERFEAQTRSADVELIVPGVPSNAQMREFEKLPRVVAVAQLRAYGLVIPRLPDYLSIAVPFGPEFGTTVDRSRIVAGRAARPSDPHEITIGESLAALLHTGVGGHIDFSAYSPAQVDAIKRGTGDVGPYEGPPVRVRIVGIDRRPLDLSDLAAAGGLSVLTPAFEQEYAGRIGVFGTRLRVDTRAGAKDATAVVASARRIFGSSLLNTPGLANETEGARNAIDTLTVALLVFAAVTALAGITVTAIALLREISSSSLDQDVLRALGLTRFERVVMYGPSVLVIAFGGALIAAVGAIAASPLFPRGVARRAEPDPGLHADWTVLALGAVVLAVVVLLVMVAAAYRASGRHAGDATVRTRRRTSSVVRSAAQAGMAPTFTNGLRLALEPGRARNAAPLRPAALGVVVGVLGVTAVLVFASSLDHVVSTPRVYGSTWDFRTQDTTANMTCGGTDYGLARQTGLDALAELCYQSVELDGRPVSALSFKPLRGGAVVPTVVAGRAPRARNEVALGAKTLHALHKHIGDTVHAKSRDVGLNFRIVGRAVFPRLGQAQPLADGAAFTWAGYAPLFDHQLFSRYFVGRFAAGADRVAIERRIAAIPQLAQPLGSTLPIEVDRLRQIRSYPLGLAALLSALALIALAHVLVGSVRRSRRELAILKTLGFDRRQVRATIAWEATTIAMLGIVVGLPAGLLVGKVVWAAVANGLGVTTTPTVPVLALVAVVAGALALVNLTAYLPARSAAQTRPGIALRSE